MISIFLLKTNLIHDINQFIIIFNYNLLNSRIYVNIAFFQLSQMLIYYILIKFKIIYCHSLPAYAIQFTLLQNMFQ